MPLNSPAEHIPGFEYRVTAARADENSHQLSNTSEQLSSTVERSPHQISELERARSELLATTIDAYQKAWSALLTLTPQSNIEPLESRVEIFLWDSGPFYLNFSQKQQYQDLANQLQTFVIDFLVQNPDKADGPAHEETSLKNLVQTLEGSPQTKGKPQSDSLR